MIFGMARALLLCDNLLSSVAKKLAANAQIGLSEAGFMGCIGCNLFWNRTGLLYSVITSCPLWQKN